VVAVNQPITKPRHDRLHAGFLALLPKVEAHARIYFRGVRRPGARADRVAEAVALAWKWYVRLAERGKDPRGFPAAFAALAARAAGCGRGVCVRGRARDALNSAAQRRHGFTVSPLPPARAGLDSPCSDPRGQGDRDALEERLCDNTLTPVPDQAAFRIDWPRFLGSLPRRDRALAQFLALGHKALEASRRFGLSPGRVTQLRQGWCRRWRAYQGAGAGRPVGTGRGAG
jgi:hypothetical protein